MKPAQWSRRLSAANRRAQRGLARAKARFIGWAMLGIGASASDGPTTVMELRLGSSVRSLSSAVNHIEFPVDAWLAC